MGFLRDRKIKRDGIPAEGRVVLAEPLNDEPGSAVVPMRLTIAVSGDGRTEREVVIKANVSNSNPVGAGSVLALKVDASDPDRVAIDWDASKELLRERGVPGLEGTEYGRAMADVLASGGKVTREQIEAMNEAARRSGSG